MNDDKNNTDKKRRILYKMIRLLRITKNTPLSAEPVPPFPNKNRTSLIDFDMEIERLRRKIGGIQYQPIPNETQHASDLIPPTFNTEAMFVYCGKCNRRFFNSPNVTVVYDGVCYSCSR